MKFCEDTLSFWHARKEGNSRRPLGFTFSIRSLVRCQRRVTEPEVRKVESVITYNIMYYFIFNVVMLC